MPRLVTDPALLAQLEAAEPQSDVTVTFPDAQARGKKLVTDPALLAQLDAPEAARKPEVNALDRVHAFATAGNAAAADVLGAPVNTAANIIDLGKAGLGYGISKLTGEAPPEALQVNGDRSNVVGSTEWIRKYLAKNAVTTPEMSRPDDTASQWIHNATKGVLGLAVGRAPGTGFTGAQRITEIAKDVTEAAGLGTAPLAIEAMGGDSATQAAGAALASLGRPGANRIRERDFGPEKMIPEPSATQTMDMDTPQMREWAVEKLTEAGVPVTKAQRGSQVMASAKRGADTILGEDPFDAKQSEAWVGAVLKTAELDGAKRATPDAMRAIYDQAQSRYNELHDTVPTIMTGSFKTKLEDIREQARTDMGESSPEFQRFSNQIDRLYEKSKLTPEAKAAQEAAAVKQKEANELAKLRAEDVEDRMADKLYEEEQRVKGLYSWMQDAKQAPPVGNFGGLETLGGIEGPMAGVPVPPAAKPAAPARESAVAKRARLRNEAKMKAAEEAAIQQQLAQQSNAPEPDRIISGRAAQASRTALGDMQAGGDATLRRYAGVLKEALDDQFDYGATAQQIELMDKTRRQFHRMKQIEDAVKGHPDGLLTPAGLMRAVSVNRNASESRYGRGDQELMDLARAGKIILPERVGNSGTASRTMDVGKIAVAVTSPATAATVGGTLLGGRIANRAGADESPRAAREAENARRDARNKAPKPEPKVPSALAGETSEERKRRLRAESLRK